MFSLKGAIRSFAILLISQTLIVCIYAEKDELERMRQKWEECCRSNANMCRKGSCYSVEWRAAAWSSVRNRCRGNYADWPFAVDVLRVTEEEDIEEIWNVLTKAKAYKHPSSELPTTVWTSGTLCPHRSPTGLIVSTRWTSNEPFPTWLEEKVNTSITEIDPQKNADCKFLVISPDENIENVNYSFKSQGDKHAAICQFLFPEPIEWNATSETSYLSSTESTSEMGKLISKPTTSTSSKSTAIASTSSKSTTITSTSSKSTTITSTSSKSTTTKQNPTEETTTILSTSTKRNEYISPGYLKETTAVVTAKKYPSTTESGVITTESSFDGCKGLVHESIHWPDTRAGDTANKSCPEGMKGYAQWTCDAKTKKFTPSSPHMQDCRHEWLENLKREVKDEKDAVEISARLANETKTNNISYGDISNIVSLTEELLGLFKKQKEPTFDPNKISKTPPPTYNLTKNIVSTFSNILRSEIKTAWSSLPQLFKKRDAAKILQQASTLGHHLSCYRVAHDYLQHSLIEENIKMQTFMFTNSIIQKNESFVFPKKEEGIIDSSKLTFPGNLSLDQFSPFCGKAKTGVGIIYKTVGTFLNDETVEFSQSNVCTPVVSFSFTNSTAILPLPNDQFVSIFLEHNENIHRKIQKNKKCVFWNFTKGQYGQWDDTGCFLEQTNSTHTKCKCNHLTNFAVLMDINDVISKDDKILELMTFICCGLSSVALLVTLICLLVIKSLHCRLSTITCNLCICLLIMNILILFGMDQTQIKILCSVIAGFLQFSVLSAFCWMLIEGYQLYQMIITVFRQLDEINTAYFYVFGYGIPGLIVSISAGLRPDDYGGENYCWLLNKGGLMWSFVGPACVIILVNLIIFIMTMRSASLAKKKKDQTLVKCIKRWMKGSLSIMCLLGLTWSIGLLYMAKDLYYSAYVFTALNGLQGVFIFIFRILLNEKTSAFLIKVFQKKLKNADMRTQCANSSRNTHKNKRSSGTSITTLVTNQSASKSSSKSSPNSSDANNKDVSSSKVNDTTNRRLSSSLSTASNLDSRYTPIYTKNNKYKTENHANVSRSVSQNYTNENSSTAEVYEFTPPKLCSSYDADVSENYLEYRIPRANTKHE